MRNFKFKDPVGSVDFYRQFVRDTGNPKGIKERYFTKILRKFNSRVADKIIFEGFSYNMPSLGKIQVIKYKPRIRVDKEGNLIRKGLAPNWNKCWKVWEEEYGKPYDNMQDNLRFWKSIKDKPLVFHNNNHSDGYRCKFYWLRETSTVKHQSLYNMRMTQEHKRKLGAAYKKNPYLFFYELKKC